MNGAVLALCGGVGGAKLAAGLAALPSASRTTIAINSGDDFEHLGLAISPDIDTVVYTLSGLADRERGWGLADESWQAMAMIERLGGESWFRLGDRDLAMHILRTRRLAAGETLSAITADLASRLGIMPRLVPMSDDPVRTQVVTDEGTLSFQSYFVERQCRPAVSAIRFAGAQQARPSPVLAELLGGADLAALIVCPSNPYLSIDPILALPGVREAIAASPAPRLAVSPIVGGEAIKGPLAKIMGELGIDSDVVAIARHYRGLIDGIVIDERDAHLRTNLEAMGLAVTATQSVMRSDEDRVDLAQAALDLAARVGRSS